MLPLSDGFSFSFLSWTCSKRVIKILLETMVIKGFFLQEVINFEIRLRGE
jgi:hypothetical protein